MDNLSMLLPGVIVIILLTGFVKMVTALSLLRYGIGLEASGFGVVVIALALALSLAIATPQIEPLGGLSGLLSKPHDSAAIESAFRPFLEKHIDEAVSKKIAKAVEEPSVKGGKHTPEGSNGTKFPVLIASFLISELKVAFQIGLMILIPFLVIDLLVVNVLASLGISQISHYVAAVPLKILLFLAVDGWTLVSEKLLLTYR